MRTRNELQWTLNKIGDVISDRDITEDALTDESWLRLYILYDIFKTSRTGAGYVWGIMAGLQWAMGEEWEFVETPGMIEGLRE